MQLFSHLKIRKEHTVYESTHTFVFLSYKPRKPFHLLISPKRKVELIQEMTEEEITDYFKVVRKMAKLQKKTLIDNFHFFKNKENNIFSQMMIIQNGSNASQSVKHVHLHMIILETDLCKLEYDFEGGDLKQISLDKIKDNVDIYKSFLN